MSDTSPNLRLPYILPAQAQKHVTHNEAVRALDALVQISVESRALVSPPATPTEGARYIVPNDASGSWSGKAQYLAASQDGAWAFFVPREGWLVWVQDEDVIYAFDGSAWVVAGGGVNPTSHVGINATADDTNRLSVSSPASLFNHEGSDHRQKINKHAAGDTASTLYQTNFSGRAEAGLAGDDNYHVKVSADGSSWKEALVVDRATGAVSLPNTPAAVPSNPWLGKKWAALGTSITQSDAYTAPLAALLGVTLVNQGVSGACIANNSGGGGSHVIHDQVAGIAGDADLVTIEAGINDFGFESTLGALGDTTTATFYGALHKAAVDVLAADPQRTLVFFTPYANASGYGTGNWNTANANGNTLAQFQQAVREVAHKFGCPVVDITQSGISAQTASLYMGDGLHINAVGGSRYAQFAYDRLVKIRPYQPQVATPIFSPTAGTYEGTQSVTISCATSGATIHYTTDGSAPTSSSPVYSGALSVSATTTVKAIAIKSGLADSAAASAAFTITTQVATPTFSPAAGSYGGTQSVTISCATSGATIHYTTDGSTPTTSSSIYSGAISIPATTTLKALAVKSGLADSAIGSAAYTIVAFSPSSLSPAMWYDASDLATLFQDTSGTTAVTSDGQAVARVNDKSGNNRDCSQATSGARPLYKTDGTSRWLLFDGVDDTMPCSEYTTPSGDWAVAWASRKASTSTDHSVVTGGANSGGDDYAGDNVLTGHPSVRANAGTQRNGGFSSSTVTSDHTVIINVSGGVVTLYQDGVAGNSYSGFTTFKSIGLSFGNPAAFGYGGRIYQLMIIPRALTSGEISDLTTWLEGKVGL